MHSFLALNASSQFITFEEATFGCCYLTPHVIAIWQQKSRSLKPQETANTAQSIPEGYPQRITIGKIGAAHDLLLQVLG